MSRMTDYNEKVLDYLEYLGYPEYVTEFKPECVATSIAGTVITFYHKGESFRMCAIVIFALTLTMQVFPHAKSLQVN